MLGERSGFCLFLKDQQAEGCRHRSHDPLKGVPKVCVQYVTSCKLQASRTKSNFRGLELVQ